jgi:hypothetical protein
MHEEAIFPARGNSDHFQTKMVIMVKRIYCTYNVIEKGNWSMITGRNGYKIAFLESIAEEEAPMSLRAWIEQKSKGGRNLC